MGIYLNSKKPFGQFFDEAAATYFVDKSDMLNELIPIVTRSEDILTGQAGINSGKSNKYVCITRPRRFGKSLIASMAASFFSKGGNSRRIFQKLKIGKSGQFENHINAHNVIYISFNETPKNCASYQEYIERN